MIAYHDIAVPFDTIFNNRMLTLDPTYPGQSEFSNYARYTP